MNTTETKPTDLAEIIDKSGMTREKAMALVAPLVKVAEQARALIEEAQSFAPVTDASQLTEMREAYDLRRKLVTVRCEADREHKLLKADVLLYGWLLDKCRRKISDECESAENKLRASEEFALRAETARKAKARDERYTALAQYGTVDAAIVGTLGDMKAEAFETMLSGAKLAKEAREAEAAKQEQARKDEQDKRARELSEARKKAKAAEAEAQKLRDERTAAEAKARTEREAAEEVARKERLRLQALADVERQKREAVEQAERERIAAEKKKADAAAKAAKKAAAAPDADKLRALAKAIKAIPVPKLTTDEGRAAMRVIGSATTTLIGVIEDQAEQIGGA
jgi:hypothetical protein